jgi:hypothetical protein
MTHTRFEECGDSGICEFVLPCLTFSTFKMIRFPALRRMSPASRRMPPRPRPVLKQGKRSEAWPPPVLFQPKPSDTFPVIGSFLTGVFGTMLLMLCVQQNHHWDHVDFYEDD